MSAPRPGGANVSGFVLRTCVTAALAVVSILVAACGADSAAQDRAHASAATPTSSAATQAVPAQLQFTAETLDGQEFRGSSLLGKPAVLWFWAPWCPTCQSEAAMVGQAATSHPSVTFVGVAGLDQVAAMKDFVDKHPVKGFTNLADTTGAIWTKFGVTQQPSFAFIRPDGGIDMVKAALSERELNRRVVALMHP